MISFPIVSLQLIKNRKNPVKLQDITL